MCATRTPCSSQKQGNYSVNNVFSCYCCHVISADEILADSRIFHSEINTLTVCVRNNDKLPPQRKEQPSSSLISVL